MAEAVLHGGGGGNMPGIVSSILLFISGAVAYFAYSDSVWTWTSGGDTHSIHVDTVGVIFMVAGVIALLLSAAYNFMQVDPIEEVGYDEVVTKVSDEEPVKTVRKSRKTTK